MTLTEILKDHIKVERRKNETLRKEWAISDVIILSSKSKFSQNEHFAACTKKKTI